MIIKCKDTTTVTDCSYSDLCALYDLDYIDHTRTGDTVTVRLEVEYNEFIKQL